MAAESCLLFLDQVEQAVSDLQRGGAVWDGKRVLAEETLQLRKVRGEIIVCLFVFFFPKMWQMIMILVRTHQELCLSFCVAQTDGELVFSHHPAGLLLRLLCLPQ